MDYLKDQSYELVGAAYEVYNELSFGLSEEIYQESLELELEFREITFVSKEELTAYYKGHALKKKYIPDLRTHGSIIVELKASKGLVAEHYKQLLNYMNLTKQPLGYLINFGAEKTLQWKRLLLSRYIPDSHK